MKIKFKKNLNRPDVGETRIITRFLILPLVLDDEMRWLETAKIKQTFSQLVLDSDPSYTDYYDRIYYDWTDVNWAD